MNSDENIRMCVSVLQVCTLKLYNDKYSQETKKIGFFSYKD